MNAAGECPAGGAAVKPPISCDSVQPTEPTSRYMRQLCFSRSTVNAMHTPLAGGKVQRPPENIEMFRRVPASFQREDQFDIGESSLSRGPVWSISVERPVRLAEWALETWLDEKLMS